MKSNRGFSLIEILGVIVILGIISIVGIGMVSTLIKNSKKTYDEQLKRTLLMAGKAYYSANKDELPKSIGFVEKVSAQDLKKSNFLKENLQNSKKDNCMENSSVSVHKTSKSNYEYSAELLCGDEVAEVFPDNPPIINISIKNSNGDEVSSDSLNNLNNDINNLFLHININGGGKSKVSGETLTVEGYSFSISVQDNTSGKYFDVYNSGTLSGGFKENVILDKAISDYIDIQTNNKILVTVLATNSAGVTIIKDSDGNVKYNDKILPTCTDSFNVTPTITSNNWINANEYAAGTTRKVKATCNPNNGIGCLRDTFTRSWPNKYQKDGVYGFVQVKDKLGYTNFSNSFINDNLCKNNNINDTCKVRINVDTTYPTLKVQAYQRTASNTTTGSNILKGGTVNAGGGHTKPAEELIKYTDYNSLTNNALNYQNGVIYKVELTDNMKVKSWKWETNKANLKNTDSDYSRYGNGPSDEQLSGSYTTNTLNNCDNNSTKNNITIAFKSKGMRKGRLTVEDIAGNIVTVTIAVNISDDSIYWALRDNNNDGKNETLVFSSSSLTGKKTGNFSSKTNYSGYSNVPWLSNGLSQYVTNVTIEKTITPESTAHWFDYAGQYAETFTANLSKLNTKNVTDMSLMFRGAGGISAKSLVLDGMANWDTSKVTDMSYMFAATAQNAKTWNIGNIKKWNVSNVTNMQGMFSNSSYYIENLDLSGWNTSKVTDMQKMFYRFGWNSSSFKLNLTGWNTSNVRDMSWMFDQSGQSGSSFIISGLDNWNTSNVTDMNHMFEYAGRAATTWSIGNLRNWNTSKVTNMGCMFYAGCGGMLCKGLNTRGHQTKKWSIGDISNWNTSKVVHMEYMFTLAGHESEEFNLGNLGKWDTSNVIYMNNMFEETGVKSKKWYIGNLSGWKTSKVINMNSMFSYAGCNATTWNIGYLNSWNTSNVTDMSMMFDHAGSDATTFDIGNLNNWNTSKVTDMNSMFSYAGNEATTFNIGSLNNWKTSKVTDMNSMFEYAGSRATTFNIGSLNNWDTSNVTDMSRMFESAGEGSKTFNIGSLNNWKTKNVVSMLRMFRRAGASTKNFNIGNLKDWDTSKVTDMRCLFQETGSNSTTFNLNIRNWNTSKVTDMNSMFYYTADKATTLSIIIPKTNKAGLSNTNDRIYGKNSSVYSSPPRNRKFTIS